MPSVAWRLALKQIIEPFGPVIEAATTTNITTSQLVVSTDLSNRFTNNDDLNGMFIVIEQDNDGGASPANVGLTKRNTDFAAATGTLTAGGTAWAEEDEAVDFFMTRVHPDDAVRAFNRARTESFPYSGIMRDVRTIYIGQHQREVLLPTSVRKVVEVWVEDIADTANFLGNVLLNGTFEDWTNATTPPNWTITGAGASVHQEPQVTSGDNYAVRTGENSARVLVPDTTVTTLLQTADFAASNYPNVASEGMEVNLDGVVLSNLASRVSARIAGADGTAHTGTGWELITHSADLGATATTAALGTVASSGDAMPYFVDSMTALVGPETSLEVNWDLLDGYDFIPPVNGEALGGRLWFNKWLPAKRRLRVIGADFVSAVSNGSGFSSTIEVDGNSDSPLFWKTRQILCSMGYELAEFRGLPEAKARSVTHCRNRYDEAINNGQGLKLPAKRLQGSYGA